MGKTSDAFLNILIYIFPLSEVVQKSLEERKKKREDLEILKEMEMEVLRLKVKEIESRGEKLLCSSNDFLKIIIIIIFHIPVCEELTDACFTKELCGNPTVIRV